MPEIKTPIVPIETDNGKLYIITETHTLADIARFFVKQANGEAPYILQRVIEEETS